MHARVSTIMGKPENIDQTVSHLDKAMIGEEKGFEGAYVLVNRQTGKLLTFTLWDSKEDLEASASVANEIRNKAAGIAGAQPASVEIYEVALQPQDVKTVMPT